MKIKPYHLMIISSVLFSSCLDSIDETIDNGTTFPPVETNPANTNYQPAFPGQTRANGVKTVTPYVSEVLASSLSSPWGITSLPDGRLLITERQEQCVL
ncbi:hypothetical protein ACFOEQ_01145 [Chryseobacterium arachidis]|uniref:hypothetical protein n=1 Tax=Chryseobacterium arachidis TaxID=1416778 RepID=UPI003614AF61